MIGVLSRGVLMVGVLAGCIGDASTVTEEETAGIRQMCGGIAGIQCPAGHDCVDDPRDDCDPANGGADCSGVCRRSHSRCRYNDPDRQYVGRSAEECAVIRFICAEGTQYFSDRCGCGCETVGTPCGPSTCGAAEVCCNESCGICTPPDGVCILQVCGSAS